MSLYAERTPTDTASSVIESLRADLHRIKGNGTDGPLWENGGDVYEGIRAVCSRLSYALALLRKGKP